MWPGRLAATAITGSRMVIDVNDWQLCAPPTPSVLGAKDKFGLIILDPAYNVARESGREC
jgi:hypothetical protein